ncbi:MAG: HEAT repeat domain-containing protein [Anaerolineales bacterium]
MDWLTGSKQGEAKKLISQLADSSKRDATAQALIRNGNDSVPALIEALQTQDLNLLLIYQHILAQIPSAIPALAKTLSTAHPLVRARTVEVLGLSKDKTSIPILLEALKSEYFTVRKNALLALAYIGDARVISALLPFLKDHEDEVRAAACVAVGKFNDSSTFDEITNVLLDDSKIEVRRVAARALGETENSSALPFLMEALRDSVWWYEKEQSSADLLNAIEKMGPVAVPPLIEALSDKEGTVRKFAASLLGKLLDPQAIDELGMTLYDLHHEVSLAAAEALAKFGVQAIDVLSEALLHPEAAVRRHAIIGLSQIQDVRVTPFLLEMLHDPDRVVKIQAVEALGQVRDSRAIPALEEIAANRSDREISMLAKRVIENIK